MRIFVIGQASTHWGRKEFGNIGNYYVADSLFKELHRVFPDAEIHTTQQLTDNFCKRREVTCVPMDFFYGWNDDDLKIAYKEFALASIYNETGLLPETTSYIKEVQNSDLVIDFSGDMWGDNAELAGKDRFLVGLLKDRVAQLLGKPTAFIAGSPGPFEKCNGLLPLAKKVFSSFNIVTTREPESLKVLSKYKFCIEEVYSCACPAFLFKPELGEQLINTLRGTVLEKKTKPVIGFMICGWNMMQGPFNRIDWNDDEYKLFVEVLETLVTKLQVNICLMSHSNGFELPPHFKLKHGRDFALAEQLYKIMRTTRVSDSIFLLDGIYLPDTTMGIVSKFDMLISGRVHGAIAGISQAIPTVMIDYGHPPVAHKIKGFADLVGMADFVADPHSSDDMINKALVCWGKKDTIHKRLDAKLPEVRHLAQKNFDLLKTII